LTTALALFSWLIVFVADLKLALPTIFLHEGRYVNNSKDPGGATNYGISLRFLVDTGDLNNDGWPDGDVNHDGKIDIKDIKEMSVDDATHLYDLYFWSKYGYARIIDQEIATKVFDLSINMGAVGAHKCAQRAVRSVTAVVLADDGILGFQSLTTINSINPIQLMPALKSEAAGYYRSIRLKQNNEKEFITGWLNRAYSNMIRGQLK
jgi:lysozyme family protein